MANRITIEPLDQLAVAGFVATFMRAADYREIMCQLPPGHDPADAGHACFLMTQPGWRWQANIKGNPVACFGLAQFTYPVWAGWAFGMPSMRRCIPAISRHFRQQRARILAEGCRCIEVRALKTHSEAHLWIKSLGATYRRDLPDRGRDGETFELWDWVYSEQENHAP